MTVLELKAKIDAIVKQGHGMEQVMFDTEAGLFNYHMASVDNVFSEQGAVNLYTADPIIHLSQSVMDALT